MTKIIGELRLLFLPKKINLIAKIMKRIIAFFLNKIHGTEKNLIKNMNTKDIKNEN